MTNNIQLQEITPARAAHEAWRILIQEDRQLRAALKAWSWRNKETDGTKLREAYSILAAEGVTLERALRAAKLAVIEDEPWNLSTLLRYGRSVAKTRNTKLRIRGTLEIDERLEELGFLSPDQKKENEILEGWDFGEDERI